MFDAYTKQLKAIRPEPTRVARALARVEAICGVVFFLSALSFTIQIGVHDLSAEEIMALTHSFVWLPFVAIAGGIAGVSRFVLKRRQERAFEAERAARVAELVAELQNHWFLADIGTTGRSTFHLRFNDGDARTTLGQLHWASLHWLYSTKPGLWVQFPEAYVLCGQLRPGRAIVVRDANNSFGLKAYQPPKQPIQHTLAELG